MKLNENVCLLQKTSQNSQEKKCFQVESKNIPQNPIDSNANSTHNFLNGSFEKMNIEENQINSQRISNPFMIIQENYEEKRPSQEENNEKKSAIFPKFSITSNKNPKKSRLSVNLSQRLSQIKVDPEKEQRKSNIFDKMLAGKKLEDLLLLSFQNKVNEIEEQDQDHKISNENEEFFSLEQEESEALKENSKENTKEIIVKEKTNEFTEENDHQNTKEFTKGIPNEFTKEKIKEKINEKIREEPSFDHYEKYDDSEEKNENNYSLTNYSSNESSNDGSHYFQWKEISSSEKIKDQFNENSFNAINTMNLNYNSQFPHANSNNYMYSLNQNNNKLTNNSNNMFFSQKTAMFGIFDNNASVNFNSKGPINNMNSQQFTSINYENNFLNEKRQSKLNLTPKKVKKKEKKLFCNAKIVPFWASDLDLVKGKIIEQKNLDTNKIFGDFVVENLDLAMIFDNDSLFNIHRFFFRIFINFIEFSF